MLGYFFLAGHFYAANVSFHYHAPWHVEALRFLVCFRKISPCKEISATAYCPPVLVKGGNSQQIRNIYVFNEILGFLTYIQKLSYTIRCKVSYGCYSTDYQRLDVRVLSAEYGVHPCGLGLETKGFNIMCRCHQVGFRGKLIC